MSDLIHALARTPICRDLSDEEVGRIADQGRVERWAAGAVILEEGTVGPRLVIVLEGRVAITKRDANGADQALGDLEAGGVLGEVSLLLQQPRSATATALTGLRVFAMERAAFEDMIAAGDPAALKMGFALARALAGRLVEMNDRVVALLDEVADHKKRGEFLRANSEIERRWDF